MKANENTKTMINNIGKINDLRNIKKIDGIDDIVVSGDTAYVVMRDGKGPATLRSYDLSVDGITIISEVEIPVQVNGRITPDAMEIFVEDGIACYVFMS